MPQSDVDVRALDTPGEILERARSLVEPLRAGAAARDRERTYPYEQLQLVRESGLEALLVPLEFGGMGGTYMDEVRVVGILAEGDSSVAQIFHVHGTGVEICTQVAPPELQKRFHEATIARKCRWSNAYSELGTKNIFEYAVKLTPDDDGYRLSGRKFYCTGSLGADVMYVTAVIDGTDQLRLVLMPTDTAGVTIEDDWDGMGQVGTASGSIVLDNVRIEASQVVEMDGMATPESLFGPLGQLSFSAIHVGIAKAACAEALDYVRTKVRPWVHAGVEDAREDPILQVRVGEMRTLLDAADAMQKRAIDAMAGVLGRTERRDPCHGVGRHVAGKGVLDRRRSSRLRDGISGVRLLGDASLARARSTLAQPAHAQPARPRRLQAQDGWRLLPHRQPAARDGVHLVSAERGTRQKETHDELRGERWRADLVRRPGRG